MWWPAWTEQSVAHKAYAAVGIQGQTLTVKGPKGQLAHTVADEIEVTLDEDDVESVRATRDELKVRVDALIESLLGEGSVLSAEEAAAYQAAKQGSRTQTTPAREAQPA